MDGRDGMNGSSGNNRECNCTVLRVNPEGPTRLRTCPIDVCTVNNSAAGGFRTGLVAAGMLTVL